MQNKILVRYGEIALKGKNRRYFEDRLMSNIKRGLKGINFDLSKFQGRFIISADENDYHRLAERLKNAFGVVSFSLATETEIELNEILKAAELISQNNAASGKSFKVVSRRSNKNFPYKSPELNQIIGTQIQKTFPFLTVDLKSPDFTIFVEISFEKAYIFDDSIKGPGGLPLGVTGKALLLLSGGIDSPVAAWMAMKRGLEIEAIHYHSHPFTSLRAKEKVIDLGNQLAKYGTGMNLHFINLINAQKAIKEKCPEKSQTIILRRMMFRIAEKLVNDRNLQALVTGDNLGQVASQTLESLTAIDNVVSSIVIRPLICLDKREIIDIAIKIGTYDTSILPFEDCCTLFTPRNPITKPSSSVIEHYESTLDINNLVADAITTLETTDISI